MAAYRLWARSLPDDIEVMAAQLPGRDGRLRDTPLPSIAAIVDMVLPAIIEASDLPYAIFGHSMGALVAYELTVALERAAVRTPSHLFVSSRRAPDEPDTRAPLHGMTEAQFLVELQERYGAIPPAVLDEPELLELLLPVVRADIRAVETYQPSQQVPHKVQCAVHVYGGKQDRHPLPAQLSAWQRVATGPVRVCTFDGDHFYLQTERDALTTDIAAQWTTATTRSEPS